MSNVLNKDIGKDIGKATVQAGHGTVISELCGGKTSMEGFGRNRKWHHSGIKCYRFRWHL